MGQEVQCVKLEAGLCSCDKRAAQLVAFREQPGRKTSIEPDDVSRERRDATRMWRVFRTLYSQIYTVKPV